MIDFKSVIKDFESIILNGHTDSDGSHNKKVYWFDSGVWHLNRYPTTFRSSETLANNLTEIEPYLNCHPRIK